MQDGSQGVSSVLVEAELRLDEQRGIVFRGFVVITNCRWHKFHSVAVQSLEGNS